MTAVKFPVTFRSKVIAGKLAELPGLFKEIVQLCEGKTLTLELNYYVKKRSNAQNAYYWPVVVEYVLEGLIDAGYRRDTLDAELVHEHLKSKFLKHLRKRIVNPDSKKYLTYRPSTSDLTTWEFMDYVEAITIFAAEILNVQIPDPDKEWRDKAASDYQAALKAGLIDETERNRVRTRLKLAALGR